MPPSNFVRVVVAPPAKKPKSSIKFPDISRGQWTIVFSVLFVAGQALAWSGVFVPQITSDVFAYTIIALWGFLGFGLIYTPDIIQWELIFNALFAAHIALQVSHAGVHANNQWINATVALSTTLAHILSSWILAIGALAMVIVQVCLKNVSTLHKISTAIACAVLLRVFYIRWITRNKKTPMTIKSRSFVTNRAYLFS